MEVLSDYRTRQRKDNRLPTHLSECHAFAPSNLPHAYIRRRKGARTQGLLATLPSRPPERGATLPVPPAKARGLMARPARQSARRRCPACQLAPLELATP